MLPSSVKSIGEDSEEEMMNLGNSFDDDILVPGKKKVKLTRGDKRKLCQQYWKQDEEKSEKHVLELSAATLKELHSLMTSKFYNRDGLLYRRWTAPGRDDGEMDVEQLVLPKHVGGK